MTARYEVGVATMVGDARFLSAAIRDTRTGEIFPCGDLELAEQVTDCLNGGMTNPMLPGLRLVFHSLREIRAQL